MTAKQLDVDGKEIIAATEGDILKMIEDRREKINELEAEMDERRRAVWRLSAEIDQIILMRTIVVKEAELKARGEG